MNAQRIHIKFYLEDDQALDPQVLIPVFHRLIQQRILDELPIDVADYRHVPEGPGLLLVTHEADLMYDTTDGRPGLLYARKRSIPGSFPERLRHTLRQALRAARAVQRQVPELRLAGHRWALRLADRLHAPNSRDTLATVEPHVLDLVGRLHQDAGFQLTWEEDPTALFGIQVMAPESLPIATLLERLEEASTLATAAA